MRLKGKGVGLCSDLCIGGLGGGVEEVHPGHGFARRGWGDGLVGDESGRVGGGGEVAHATEGSEVGG